MASSLWICILVVGVLQGVCRGQGVTSMSFEGLACEGTTLVMTCPGGYGIRIHAGFFGRNDTQTCVRQNGNTRSCDTPDVLPVLQNKCDNTTSCEVQASVVIFGESGSCRARGNSESAVSKFLMVRYTCEQTVIRALLCEASGRITIRCPKGLLIETLDAMWGRRDPRTCPHTNIMHTDCASNTSRQIFRGMCDGKEKCEVDAQVATFGDPCPGSYKYLTMSYTCSECKNEYSDQALCSKWEQRGECKVNADWMIPNCRQSCWNCQPADPKPEPVNCVNKHNSSAQCEYWANINECEANPDFMIKNCFRACSNCSKEEPPCVNARADFDCDQWADRGECTSNAAFMTPYCRQSCHCRYTECTDQYFDKALCTKWMNDGLCTDPDFSAFMLAECRKSCFGCDDNSWIDCENRYWNVTQCEEWAALGECDYNPGFMLARCTKSCLKCTTKPECKNVAPIDDCTNWARGGECSKNPTWMYRNCWQACTNCRGRQACVNTHENNAECDYWRKDGECHANANYMYVKCTKACTHCKPDIKPSACVNVWSNETECNEYEADGECYKSPLWMYDYCRKSCSKCDMPNNNGSVGSPILFGEVNKFTKDLTMILSQGTFPTTAKLTHFMVFLRSTNKVELQVWRFPSIFDNPVKLYQAEVTASAPNEVRTVAVRDACIMVQPGDKIGFSTPNGISPIGYKFDPSVGSHGPIFYRSLKRMNADFDILPLPYSFSLAAGYNPDDKC